MKEFEQIAVKINSKEDYKKSKKLFQKLGYKNDKKWNEFYIDKIGGVIKYNLGFESGMFSLQSSCANFKTFKSIKEFKEYVKSKEPKKGKLTIVVSKNYKELYEDNLALVNHILLDSVKNDKEWIEKVQKYNLNITLYTDKNDTELFKKSFGKFEVKLMDKEECNNNLKGLVLVSQKGEAKSIEELHAEHKEQSFNKIKEEEFYKGLEVKLNQKGLCVEWMEEFNKIPGHVFDALKFRTPQAQRILKVDSNQVNTNHNLKPKQYQIGIDTFERAKANLTKEEYLACLKFGIDKYTWRLKGQDIEDFEKIIAYANEAINVLKSKK